MGHWVQATGAPLRKWRISTTASRRLRSKRSLDVELFRVIKEAYGEAGLEFSRTRLQKALRLMGKFRCLECDARYPSFSRLRGHLRESGHHCGRKIKKHIECWKKEIGFGEECPLISLTDENLVELGFPEVEYRETRDIFLLKNCCYVHRSERDAAQA